MKEKISQLFFDKYGLTPSIIVKSPGRVNIIGEHTDYNEGFVLPAAINNAAYFAVKLRDDGKINLLAGDLKEVFATTLLEIKPSNQLSWANYILGAVAQFQKLNIEVKGFDAVLISDVPVGAGLSSSAAVETTVIFALNELLQAKLDKISMIKMAQQTEHEFAGVMCGIMDMFASVMGKKDHLIKLDCRSLEYEYIPFKLEGIKILLLNTNVKHSLASSEYNTRRNECRQAVQWIKEYKPAVNSLRDVTETMLDKYVLPKSKLIDKRSRFVVQEIERLQNACADLQKGDIPALGRKMFDTHNGLSKMYDVSCKELDYLVNAVKDNDAVIGARMMGGGFGGCTINLVKEIDIENLIAKIKAPYESVMGLPLSYHVASIEGGTAIV